MLIAPAFSRTARLGAPSTNLLWQQQIITPRVIRAGRRRPSLAVFFVLYSLFKQSDLPKAPHCFFFVVGRTSTTVTTNYERCYPQPSLGVCSSIPRARYNTNQGERWRAVSWRMVQPLALFLLQTQPPTLLRAMSCSISLIFVCLPGSTTCVRL